MSINRKAFWVLFYFSCLLSNNRTNQQMGWAYARFLGLCKIPSSIWRPNRFPVFASGLEGHGSSSRGKNQSCIFLSTEGEHLVPPCSEHLPPNHLGLILEPPNLFHVDSCDRATWSPNISENLLFDVCTVNICIVTYRKVYVPVLRYA